MEMILNLLHTEVSQLFMINEKFSSSKEEILDFCDRIREDKKAQDSQERPNDPSQLNFDANNTHETDEEMLVDQPSKSDPQSVAVASTSRGRRGRGRGRGGVSNGKIVKRGRPKKLNAIPEKISDDEDCDYLDQMSTRSKSSWSTYN